MRKFNWRTTLAGLITIGSLFLDKPATAVITNPNDLAVIVAGVGLILSRDSANHSPIKPKD